MGGMVDMTFNLELITMRKWDRFWKDNLVMLSCSPSATRADKGSCGWTRGPDPKPSKHKPGFPMPSRHQTCRRPAHSKNTDMRHDDRTAPSFPSWDLSCHFARTPWWRDHSTNPSAPGTEVTPSFHTAAGLPSYGNDFLPLLPGAELNERPRGDRSASHRQFSEIPSSLHKRRFFWAAIEPEYTNTTRSGKVSPPCRQLVTVLKNFTNTHFQK